MGTTIRHKQSVDNKVRRKSRGFSLIEVMIAMVIVTVGLLAVIASFATAIAATQSAQEDLIARHKALDAMESIYTARNSQQIAFSAIANQASGGIFKGGAQALLCAGPDGLVGTADDVACTTVAGAVCPNGGVECMVLPGPDGILGNADDQIMSLANFRRTITISQVLLPNGQINPDLMAITVAVTYFKTGWPARTYTANGLISSYH
jgi:prepilin-type N-terminal cleavage/methylation domain-containing protein